MSYCTTRRLRLKLEATGLESLITVFRVIFARYKVTYKLKET